MVARGKHGCLRTYIYTYPPPTTNKPSIHQTVTQDEEYYEGRVTGFDPAARKHSVTYDDGEVESISLANEKIKWPGAAPEAAATAVAAAAAASEPSSKKRRVVAEEEESGSEAEFDFGAGGAGSEKTPGGFASASASSAAGGGRKSVQSKAQGGSASGDGGAGKRARCVGMDCLWFGRLHGTCVH